jgi:hypothetical protein
MPQVINGGIQLVISRHRLLEDARFCLILGNIGVFTPGVDHPSSVLAWPGWGVFVSHPREISVQIYLEKC